MMSNRILSADYKTFLGIGSTAWGSPKESTFLHTLLAQRVDLGHALKKHTTEVGIQWIHPTISQLLTGSNEPDPTQRTADGSLYCTVFFFQIGLGFFKKVLDTVDSTNLCQTQAKAASELIKAGRENGAKRIRTTTDQRAGLNFEAPIEGVKIKAMAGSEGNMTIEVDYL